MVKPEVRRQNDILVTQKLWAAISVTRQQKQIPNLERITRYLEREYSMKESDIVHSLQLASDDQLIIQYNAVGCKGARIGVEQEGYRIPSSAGLVSFEQISCNNFEFLLYDGVYCIGLNCSIN